MEITKTEVTLDVKIGSKFNNLEQFEEDLMRMCGSKCVQFYKKTTKSIQSASRNITRYMNPALKYYSIRWCCIHADKRDRTRIKEGTWKTPASERKEVLCPAYIQVRIDESGNNFEVVDVNFTHTHLVAQELPPKTILNDIKADTMKLLEMKGNKELIRAELGAKLNRTVTLEELWNLEQAFSPESKPNDIHSVSHLIKALFGTDCHWLIFENHVIEGLYFSSPEMLSSLTAYPEIIFIGAVLKLSALDASVYVILNVDGNGESCIVAVAVLMNEDETNLQWFIQTFKDSLPPETQIINVMTDKDFIARDILRRTFPRITLHLCACDILNMFKREINGEKFQIPSRVRNSILELIEKLVYSKSESVFGLLINKLAIKAEGLYKYLTDGNWLSIKEEWCPFLGKKYKNFMDNNNRIEDIGSKLKAAIDKNCSLEEFVTQMASVINFLEKEKYARVANVLNKDRIRPCNVDDLVYDYLKLLTPYAFEKVTSQFSFDNLSLIAKDEQFYIVKCKDYQVETSYVACTCCFHNSMGLPCKHIFAVRQHNYHTLFDPSLVLDRWKMSNFTNNCRFLYQHVESSSIENSLCGECAGEVEENPLTPQEKFKISFEKAKLVANLSCDLHEDQYRNVNAVLDALINDLENGTNDFVERAVLLIGKTNDYDEKHSGYNADVDGIDSKDSECDISVIEKTTDADDESTEKDIKRDVVDELGKTASSITPNSQRNSFESVNLSQEMIKNEDCHDYSMLHEEIKIEDCHDYPMVQEKIKIEVEDHDIGHDTETPKNETKCQELDLKNVKVTIRKKRERESDPIEMPKQKRKTSQLMPFSDQKIDIDEMK